MALAEETKKELQKTLEKERGEIVTHLKTIAVKDPIMRGDWDARFPQFETVEYGSHSSLDEEANEVEEFETRLEAEHSLESRLLAITDALHRISDGSYGICVKCAKAIPEDRLKANPASSLHIECAEITAK